MLTNMQCFKLQFKQGLRRIKLSQIGHHVLLVFCNARLWHVARFPSTLTEFDCRRGYRIETDGNFYHLKRPYSNWAPAARQLEPDRRQRHHNRTTRRILRPRPVDGEVCLRLRYRAEGVYLLDSWHGRYTATLNPREWIWGYVRLIWASLPFLS